MSRFDYVKYDEISQVNQDAFKSMVCELSIHIAGMGDNHYKTLAMDRLEECYMYIGKCIRDEQFGRELMNKRTKNDGRKSTRSKKRS